MTAIENSRQRNLPSPYVLIRRTCWPEVLSTQLKAMLVVLQVDELEVKLIVLGIVTVVCIVGACYDSCVLFGRRQLASHRNWWD